MLAISVNCPIRSITSCLMLCDSSEWVCSGLIMELTAFTLCPLLSMVSCQISMVSVSSVHSNTENGSDTKRKSYFPLLGLIFQVEGGKIIGRRSGGSRIFPRGGARQLQKVLLFFNFLPKTAWKWKNLDPRGGGGASLAPPHGSANAAPPIWDEILYIPTVIFSRIGTC